MRLFLQKLFGTIGEVGFWETGKRSWKVFLSRWRKDAFDAKYGTDTGGLIPLWQLSIPSDNVRFGIHYQACDEATFDEVVRLLDVDPGRFTFVDLGCGKGRPLLMASRHGFRKVIGIEFSPKLAEIAQANIAKLHIDRADVLTMDAAEYVFPDDNLVVFSYNSFGAEVLSKVVDNLVKITGREVRFVYARPEFSHAIENSGVLRCIGEGVGSVPIQIWAPV